MKPEDWYAGIALIILVALLVAGVAHTTSTFMAATRGTRMGTVTGREGFVWGVVLIALLVFIAWLVITVGFGVQAVECVNNQRLASDGYRNPPAMQVEVYTARSGQIVERSIRECTFYSYNGPQAAGLAD